MQKNTKIIATVGPATESREMLKSLYENGVNIIRFNFSHADYDTARRIATTIHKLNTSGETNLSLLLDTKGPEIRSGDLIEKISYQKGDTFEIVIDPSLRTSNMLYCDYPYLIEDVRVGSTIEIDSGLFHVTVIEKKIGKLVVRAENSAIIGSRRHINLPGVRIRLPGITDKDKADILFAIENNYHFIAASFIRTADNVHEIREFLDNNGGRDVQIISKIENAEGIENLESIVEISDGVMVARGDLGIEVPIEKVPKYQKNIVDLCRTHGKYVIVATHMLESMIEHPFPTRAEVSDIFRAVLHGTDATMLSGETTTGKYPIESVTMMRKVIEEAEGELEHKHHEYSNAGLTSRDIEKKALIRAGITMAETLGIGYMILFTKSGRLARLAAAYRPNIEIIAFTGSEATLGTMNILYGIDGIRLDNWTVDHEINLDHALTYLRSHHALEAGTRIIAITDIMEDDIEIPALEIWTV